MADIYVRTTGNDSTGDGSTGNPYATPGKGMGVRSGAGNLIIGPGTYTVTTTTANVAGGPMSYTGGGGDTDVVRIMAEDPSNRPVIEAGTGITGISLFATSGHFFTLESLVFDGKGNTTLRGIDLGTGWQCTVLRCWAKNCTNGGIVGSGSDPRFANTIECEVSGCSTAGPAFTAVKAVSCTSHGNTVSGMSVQDGFRCLSYSNTGVGFAGGGVLVNCVSALNSSSGMSTGSGNTSNTSVINCIFSGNGGAGISFSNGSSNFRVINAAFYNNTSGSGLGSLANPDTFATGTVTLTGDPFTNAAAGDFSLNNTAGAGAACRAAGIPGAFPGGTTTGYLDIGAAQHQDAGGGGGTPTYSRSRVVNA